MSRSVSCSHFAGPYNPQSLSLESASAEGSEEVEGLARRLGPAWRAQSISSLMLGATPPLACSPPHPPTVGVLGLQPNPPQTEPPSHPLLEPEERERVTAEKVGTHTPQSWRKARRGRGGGGGGGRPRAAPRCRLLAPPPLSALRPPGPLHPARGPQGIR